jgi:Secretion system C-terminal sorting domain/Kelch motif
VLFLGGENREKGQESDVMDIYDPTSQTWSVSTMPNPRYDMSYYATATKLYTYGKGFSDKNKVNVFDATAGTWSQLTVQAAANSSNSKIKGLGSKLYINYDQVLHEFDLGTQMNTALNNTGVQRRETALEVVGTKVMIAGGIVGNTVSKDIDVYDTVAKTWSKSSLSEARRGITTLLHQQKAYFVGGGTDNGYKYSAVMDVYDIATAQWTTITMPFKRRDFALAALGDNIYLAGGYTEAQAESDAVNIYNIKTKIWTESKLSAKKSSLSAVADGKKVYFAGGNSGSLSSQSVDIWSPTTGLIEPLSLGLVLSVFPNPTTDKLLVTIGNYLHHNLSLRVSDNSGRIVYQEKLNGNNNIELNTTSWQQGIYIITLSDGKAVQSSIIQKE